MPQVQLFPKQQHEDCSLFPLGRVPPFMTSLYLVSTIVSVPSEGAVPQCQVHHRAAASTWGSGIRRFCRATLAAFGAMTKDRGEESQITLWREGEICFATQFRLAASSESRSTRLLLVPDRHPHHLDAGGQLLPGRSQRRHQRRILADGRRHSGALFRQHPRARAGPFVGGASLQSSRQPHHSVHLRRRISDRRRTPKRQRRIPNRGSRPAH